MILRPSPDPNKNSDSNFNMVIFFIIGGILIAIVLGLIITILIFNQRNQNLLKNVKNVSFQNIYKNMDPNLLLRKSTCE